MILSVRTFGYFVWLLAGNQWRQTSRLKREKPSYSLTNVAKARGHITQRRNPLPVPRFRARAAADRIIYIDSIGIRRLLQQRTEMVPGTIYKDEPYKACLYCTPYKDKQGQPNTRRKKCDLGSNQEPMRVRFGGGVGCVFLAVFLAVSTSASGSRGVSNRFHSVPSI